MKFKMKVHKKTANDYPFETNINKILNENNVRYYTPTDYGIITACNKNHFPGLQFLICSIRTKYDIPIFVFDIGMSAEQLKHIKNIKNLKVSELFTPPVDMNMYYWEAWAKPFYTLNSPFDKSIWIDSDAIVTGDLLELIKLSCEKPLFTQDHSGVGDGTLNNIGLYNELPIDNIEKDTIPYLNTGIYILDSKRDRKLIEIWCYCVTQAVKNKNIANNICCWDQGACKWALQKTNMTNAILSDVTFNYPALSRHKTLMPIPSSMKIIINEIKYATSNKIIIYHWMGSPKPWYNWGILNFNYGETLK